MRLLLIRHAETPANVAGALSTSPPGPGITELGRSQASALAETLADVPLDGLYVSTLQRTAITAEPLARAHGLDAVVIDGVHEIEAGDFEDSTDPQAFRDYIAPIRRWGEGDLSATIPGAHDGHHFLARFDGAIAAIAERHGLDSTVGVVSHAGAIRVWLGGRASNLGPDFAGAHHLDNTGVVDLDGSPTSGWRVVAWQGEPLGGEALEDDAARDPMGGTL
ncbi:histidine phosphatase [Frondihabitans sp. PAMC 28766]|uniref:histidine phosphatase family protein n=1 Tax=Frondihabitans sp. PAMC 28766 TaxID=1795630 RepID=UPI00078D4DED|nr:histidine phosphatase family protein [Frondihabitans sp. PAMC 28766]AMM22574.1 histidine phosphatase [Frondihabitans sp. PAMC 28766]